MSKEEAINTLKENCCAMCAYCSKDMDSCDISGCDNKDAIKVLEQEPCDDAISRQAAIDAIFAEPLYKPGMEKRYAEEAVPAIFEKIKALPPVTPAEKVGHWITTITSLGKCCICSECESCPPIEYRFCPYCGAKMQEGDAE